MKLTAEKVPVRVEVWPAVLGPEKAPQWVRDATDWEDDGLTVCTREGLRAASTDCVLIRGVEGEVYPCALSIFRKTYGPIRLETETGDDPDLAQSAIMLAGAQP